VTWQRVKIGECCVTIGVRSAKEDGVEPNGPRTTVGDCFWQVGDPIPRFITKHDALPNRG
jgi:hypothetical protein